MASALISARAARTLATNGLLHRQLEQQPPDPAAQCVQLTLQHIGEGAGQVIACTSCVQVAGIKTDGLLDILVFGGAVVPVIVALHHIPHRWVRPDRVACFAIILQSNPSIFEIASGESPKHGPFLSLCVRTASRAFLADQKSVAPPPGNCPHCGQLWPLRCGKAPGLSPALPLCHALLCPSAMPCAPQRAYSGS